MNMLVQPALVGVMAALKGILYDDYFPESPHLWVDVGLHVVAELIASGITMEFLVPEAGDMARIADPLLHGGISGLVKGYFLDRDTIASLALVEVRGGLPSSKYYSFESGFLQGAGYGSVASGVAYGTGL